MSPTMSPEGEDRRLLRVAVIGAGHWGPNLIANFHNHRDSEVAWVVDMDAARLQAVKARFHDVGVAADAGTALRDDSVDAVVIATPTSTHFPIAREALERGRHVLVEKPLASSVAQAETLCELAERRERVLMVGHVFLYNPGIRKVKEYIGRGDLGRLYYLSMTRTNLGPIRADANAAWDLASHDIAIANYWLDATPESVSARGGSWINPPVEDAVFATLRYPEGVLVHLHASWLNPRKARDITVVGERGMLTFDDMNLSEPVRLYDKEVTADRVPAPFIDSFASFRSSTRDGDILIPKVGVGEPLKLEVEHFLDCVLQGRPPATGARQGLAVVRVLEDIDRSLKCGGAEVAAGR